MGTCPVCGAELSESDSCCKHCLYEPNVQESSQKTVLETMEQEAFSAGQFIAGRYEIQKVLGQGGMGVVYLVRDTKLRFKKFALKMVRPELVRHESARQRFKDEVLLCLELQHKNIVRVNNLEEWNESLFFTMAYIPGVSLRQALLEKSATGTVFSVEESSAVIVQLLDALELAHKHTVHRDIKPENIIISGEFPEIKIKILDFGIAKAMSSHESNQTNRSIGTAYYMAPEQLNIKNDIDGRADLYSAGMIFYEMITGELAIGRFSSPSQIVPDVSPELDNFINKLLAVHPKDRFQDAKTAGKILNQILDKGKTPLKILEDNNTQPPVQKEESQTAPANKNLTDTVFKKLATQAKIQIQDRDWDGLINTGEKMLELNPDHNEGLQFLTRAKEALERIELLTLKIDTCKNNYTALKYVEELKGLSNRKKELFELEQKIKKKIEADRTEEKKREQEIRIKEINNNSQTNARHSNYQVLIVWVFYLVAVVIFYLIWGLGVLSWILALAGAAIAIAVAFKIRTGRNNALNTDESPMMESTSAPVIRCGNCNLELKNDYMIGGTCQAAGCKEKICKNCWNGLRIRQCINCR